MMTIFAVLGVNLFHNVSPNQDIYGNVGDSTGFPSDNYRTLGNAMLMLLRQTTGEAWNYVMWYCMQADNYKGCDVTYGGYLGDGCGSPAVGVFYHVLWQLVGTYVLMQLFTAIIIDQSLDCEGGSSIIDVNDVSSSLLKTASFISIRSIGLA
jgi:hypothetical protein